VLIAPSPFEALDSEEREALIVAARQYGEFLERKIDVSEN
jgi:hypothetical protein